MMFKWKKADSQPTVSGVAGQSSDEGSKTSMGTDVRDWLRTRIEQEHYWFHKIELPGGLVTPGWSDPRSEKLPYFGLPEDMRGMRVLDVGHAEGFFSFEAERRGAAEVVAIENYPPMARKFEICRAAFSSKTESRLANVYDLNPESWGTFDLVMFFGVLYHLRHPILALQKIRSVCTGSLLMQTATCEDQSEKPMAEFHPFGITSGPPENPSHDPTCFWFPNIACCAAMLEHVGFLDVQGISSEGPVGGVFRAMAPAGEGGASDRGKCTLVVTDLPKRRPCGEALRAIFWCPTTGQSGGHVSARRTLCITYRTITRHGAATVTAR